MVRNIVDGRSRWLPLLIAFLAGVLVGWWAIGWGVWPVKYTNSLPQDLRAAERDQYLLMTAESYAATGDVTLARERLATWPADALATDLQTLRDRLMTENAMQASQVQLLTGVLGVSAAAPPAVTPPTAPARSESLLRTLCTAGLWVVLALLGIAVGVWLYNRWRNAQARRSGPAIGEAPPAPRGRSLAGSERVFVTDAEQGRTGEPGTEPAAPDLTPSWPRTSPESEMHVDEMWTEADLHEERLRSEAAASARREAGRAVDARPAARVEPAPAGLEPPVVARPRVEGREIPRPAAGLPTTPAAAPRVSATPGKVVDTSASAGEYIARYQMGEPDYDEAFDITSGDGVYLGQCGLELNDPIGRGHDQAAALQVWLWDTKDPDTQVKVLMSEAAYRDTALRDQLAGEHPAMSIRAGSEFELESHNLLLRGRVEKLEYAEQEPVGGIFAELALRMAVYQKGR